MTQDDAPRPRMLSGLSHRYGDALTVEQLRAREAAERERAAARNAPSPEPPQPLSELVTIGGKPPPPKPRPRRSQHADEVGKRDRAVSKLLTTTDALSAEERKIVRGYRLSIGGPAAEAEHRLLDQEIARERTRR